MTYEAPRLRHFTAEFGKRLLPDAMASAGFACALVARAGCIGIYVYHRAG